MKIKILLAIAVIFSAFLFITACDDDLSTIGEGIIPTVDNIEMKVGEIQLTAKTVSLDAERIYVDSEGGSVMLGELEDPTFGSVKADFLTELFTANESFTKGDNGEATVDSVKLHMYFAHSALVGDSVSPMAVTVYEVDNPLKVNYYADTDPSEYTNKKKVLGQRYFSPQELDPVISSTIYNIGKRLTIDLDKEIGLRIYNEWKTNSKVLSDFQVFRKFIKGIYVTSDFNNKAIIAFENINSTVEMSVYYSYVKEEKDKEGLPFDSTYVRRVAFPAGAEALRLNRVINSPVDEIIGFDEFDTKTFIKSPSRVATEITIPLKTIREQAIDKMGSDKFMINTASFKLLGLTEEEDKLNITMRPDYLLFINKDSLDGYLNTSVNSKITELTGTTTKAMLRNSNNNTYYFSSVNSISATSNNLASLISHYIKEAPELDEVTYYLIPISIKMKSTTTIDHAIHSYNPSAAIFRTGEEFMKMKMIYSRFNEIEKK